MTTIARIAGAAALAFMAASAPALARGGIGFHGGDGFSGDGFHGGVYSGADFTRYGGFWADFGGDRAGYHGRSWFPYPYPYPYPFAVPAIPYGYAPW